MPVSIHIDGIEAVERKLGTLAAHDALRNPMEASLALVQNRIATYPTPPSGQHVTFVSDRQRRGFFAKLRSGEITVPYRRTGTLGRRWTSKIDESGSSLVGVVGNNTEYAPWVQSVDAIGNRGPQARIHQGRWETDAQVVAALRDRVAQIFERAIASLIGR